MKYFRFAPTIAALAVACSIPIASSAQDGKHPADTGKASGDYPSVEALNEHYRELGVVERRHQIEDLAALATKSKGDVSDSAYRQAFDMAIFHDEFAAAEKAAKAYLATNKPPSRTRAMATLVNLMAKAGRGEHEDLVGQFQALLKAPDAERFEPGLFVAMGEPIFEALIRDGQFDQARKLCKSLADEADSRAVREHFSSRLERLQMLGKPAPPISGTGPDGEAIHLADFKGKYVLVDFWATWCPPCVAEAPALKDLRSRYKERGFEILGVNVDAAREGQDDSEGVQSTVRRFLVKYGADWPNIMEKSGGDAIKAYGVKEIPATFLVDREGKIIQVERTGEDLERVVSDFFEKADTTKKAAKD